MKKKKSQIRIRVTVDATVSFSKAAIAAFLVHTLMALKACLGL